MYHDKVSIMIPVYNAEKYLKQCLDSIVNQSYSNLEIIITNDGSTDSSEEIIKQYMNRDKRIVYKYQYNSGISATRNNLKKMMTGTYGIYIDSDDYLEERAIEKLLHLGNSNNADIITFNYCEIKNNQKYVKRPENEEIQIYHKEEAKKAYILGDDNLSFVIWRKFCRKEIFDNITFPEIRYIPEDMFTGFEFVKNANIIVHCNQNLYYYRVLQNSLTTKKERIDKEEATKVEYEIFKLNKEEYKKRMVEVPSFKNIITSQFFNQMIMSIYALNKIEDKIYVKKIEEELKQIKIKEINVRSKLIYIAYKVAPKSLNKVIDKYQKKYRKNRKDSGE